MNCCAGMKAPRNARTKGGNRGLVHRGLAERAVCSFAGCGA